MICWLSLGLFVSLADDLWDEIPIDTLQIKVRYHVSFRKFKKRVLHEDVNIVEIGKQVLHSYSEQERRYDLIMTENERKEGRKDVQFAIFYAQFGDCYINYPFGEQSIVLNLHAAGRYKYTEPVLKIDWKIGNETKEILGYKCTKATASHRGRNWTAWFANDIPVNGGPVYFGSLPGLILELLDIDNDYHFECNAIEKPENPTPIYFIGREYVETTRTKTRKAEKAYLKNSTAFFEEYGRHVYWAKDDPMTDMPYNPIEQK